jgi:periplasmic protein CpxP/Spy
MQKSRLLVMVIVGLLASNLLLAGYIIMGRNRQEQHERPDGPPPHRGPRDLIIRRLGFTGGQVEAYDKLIQWHRSEIDRSDEQMMHLKNDLYATLNEQPNTNRRDSLINEIVGVQRNIEQIHYKHFEDLRALCTAAQMPAFNELTNEIAALFGRPPHKPGRP